LSTAARKKRVSRSDKRVHIFGREGHLKLSSDEIRKLRRLGEQAALTGKPSFDDIPDISHDEEERAEFEKAYWGTAVELRNEGH